MKFLFLAIAFMGVFLVFSPLLAAENQYDALRTAFDHVDADPVRVTEGLTDTVEKVYEPGGSTRASNRLILQNDTASSGRACWALTSGDCPAITCDGTASDGTWLDPGAVQTVKVAASLDVCFVATSTATVQVSADTP